jgi:hypothetical protein
VRASDALCRAADSRSRAPTSRSRTPCRVTLLIRTAPSRDAPTSRLPPRQAHLDRRWFRATDQSTNQSAFHRIDPDLAARAAQPRLLFTCMASPRTLSLVAIPSCLVKGRRSASSYPFAPGSYPGCPRAAPDAPRKMRLSDFCNRLHLTSTPRTARFPAASLTRDASRRGAFEHAGSPWAMDQAATR